MNSVLGELGDPPADTVACFHIADYGQRVWLRPRSRDVAAFDFIAKQHHLPPDIDPPMEHMAVFGANIGLLLIDLAARYPQARLLGVEPDRHNAAVARRNLAPLGSRCLFIEAAVWHEAGYLDFSRTRDAWGLNLTENTTPDERDGETRPTMAIDAAAVLKEFSGGRSVDYLLVNIESAWYELFQHGEWTRDVRSVVVEIQDHYDEAVPLLESLGYRAQLRRLDWGAFVVGVR